MVDEAVPVDLTQSSVVEDLGALIAGTKADAKEARTVYKKGRVTAYDAAANTITVTTEGGSIAGLAYLSTYLPEIDDDVFVVDAGEGFTFALGSGAPGKGSSVCPAGMVSFFAMNTIPLGWLDLNSFTTVSRTTYARLFAAIGTTWGVGDGSTTFTLPPASGKFLLARSGTFALASTGGAVSVAMTLAMLIQHTHTQNAHSHTPGTSVSGANSGRTGLNFIVDNNAGGAGVNASGTANGMQVPSTASTTAVNQNAGSATPTAIPTMPPYAAMACAIKT